MLDLRLVNRRQFTSAKRFWAAAIGVKLVIFGVGGWAVFLGAAPVYLPQFVLCLAILSEVLQLRSDGLKSRAETLLRTLDICRSFGREISESDRRNIIYNVSRALRKRFVSEGLPDTYFASQTAPGPKKALENLVESAWYTRRLAGAMAALYMLMILVFLLVSISALVVALREVQRVEVREQIIRLTTAWLMLLISLNMLKSAWSYFRMYQRCERTELVCDHLLTGSPSEADAIKQWSEYHLARAASPLIPDWLWKIQGQSLDDAWSRARGN